MHLNVITILHSGGHNQATKQKIRKGKCTCNKQRKNPRIPRHDNQLQEEGHVNFNGRHRKYNRSRSPIHNKSQYKENALIQSTTSPYPLSKTRVPLYMDTARHKN